MATTSYINNNLGLTSGWANFENGWGEAMNNNMLLTDTLIQCHVKQITNSAPTTDTVGNAYVVDTSPTGLFAGNAGNIAVYNGTAYTFIIPKDGWRLYNEEDDTFYYYFKTNGWSIEKASAALKLNTARTINITGDATASGTFDGTSDLTLATTLANTAVTAGSYGPSNNNTLYFNGTISVPYITVDVKGRVTGASTKTITLQSSPLTSTGVSYGSYGPSSNLSPSFSGTFTVPYYTVNSDGRISASSNKTITLPANPLVDTGVTAGTYGLGTTSQLSPGSSVTLPNFTIDSKGRVTNVATNTFTLPTSANTLSTARTLSITGDGTASGSFDGSADLALSLTLVASGVTAGSYGPDTNATPNFSESFNVPYVTVDTKGRVTAASTKTITLPDAKTSYIAVCNSAEALTTKVASTTNSNYKLEDGANIFIIFTEGNTATSFTLNIDSTGDKPFFYDGKDITSDLIPDETMKHLVYLNSKYYLVGGGASSIKTYITTNSDGDYVVDADLGGTGYVALDTNNDIVIG